MITAHHLVFGRKAIVKNEGLILDLPFQNSFVDATGKNTMVAASNLPTFTLEGGEYAATFNGSQSLKTNANFVIGTDKVSISFWIKTTQTTAAILTELSSNFNNSNAFVSIINDTLANRISIVDHMYESSYNVGNSAININDSNWHHVVLMINRSLVGNQQNKIYVDGVLSYVQNTTYQTDFNGNWELNPLFIGQRGGSSVGFNGQMKFLKIFNYPLSQTEITNLYNKTM